jgi:hypothetical protein
MKLQVLITKIAESYNPAYGHRKKKSAAGKSAPLFKGLKWFFRPVMAPLLQNRWIILIFAGVGVVQLMLTIAGLPGWQCPVRAVFGVTCPGCGLTTAVGQLLKGDWQTGVQTHAFAPLLLIILILMLAAIALPAAYLSELSDRVARLEQKTGITAIILLSMVVYWLLRVFDFI